MISRHLHIAVCLALATLAVPAQAGEIVAGFDDLTLAPKSYNRGPMPNATLVDGPYGKVAAGSFTTGGVTLNNRYDTTYGSWGGFAYSNTTDTTTAGYLNQFSAYAGGGHSGTNYGVAFGYASSSFNPQTPQDFGTLPTIILPTGGSIEGMFVTNTTYAALSMLNGDSFAKKFDTGDWFKLTAYGFTSSGLESVDFYLADYRSSNAADHYILDAWAYMDLSSLAGATQLWFNVSSSDVGQYGMNTPGYFAVDDITYSLNATAVPEPTGLVMAASAVAVVGLSLRRRQAAA
ncbi:DUF4465 domain-containing protein [Paludisphaera rhizosphaerae]|uniref:DUF4465 domain-containing protein n=1 Tax=Paludisphaera rhizosphaerae TaxID=2711216 RepID=UPI0013ED77AA|nr:DUF4465 domain-containing protein [Paludisphaera rhizosphaerae]